MKAKPKERVVIVTVKIKTSDPGSHVREHVRAALSEDFEVKSVRVEVENTR